MYFSVVTKTFFHQTGIFLLHSNLKMFFFSSFLFMVVEIKKLFGSLKPINFQRKNSANIFTDMLMMFKIFLLSGNWHFELFSERLSRNFSNLCTSWLVVTAEDGEKICRQFTARYSLTCFQDFSSFSGQGPISRIFSLVSTLSCFPQNVLPNTARFILKEDNYDVDQISAKFWATRSLLGNSADSPLSW